MFEITCNSSFVFSLGCEINTVNAKRHTPLYVACEKNDDVIAKKILTDRKFNSKIFQVATIPQPLLAAVGNNHVHLVDVLIKAGSHINMVSVLLTLFRPMGCPIKLHTIKLGWSIPYIEGSQVIILKKIIVFLSLKIDFVLANSVDPDEMLHYAAFHLGLHCLPNYPFRVYWSSKGENLVKEEPSTAPL